MVSTILCSFSYHLKGRPRRKHCSGNALSFALLKDMQPDGVSFGDINLFRNTELAHSLHSRFPLMETYKLVQDIEAELLVFRLGY